MESIILKNEYVYIRIQPDMKEIFFSDSTDHANGTSGYTTKKRGVKLFSQFVIKVMNDEKLKSDINFKDMLQMLNNANVPYRTYCAVD